MVGWCNDAKELLKLQFKDWHCARCLVDNNKVIYNGSSMVSATPAQVTQYGFSDMCGWLLTYKMHKKNNINVPINLL